MKSDIQIAQEAKYKEIEKIAEELNISKYIENYGQFKAKIDVLRLKKEGHIDKYEKKGKLILVTAVNPTPAGEGKTTTTVGLGDGLRKIGKKSIIALREPSLGPVFGLKGGAAGGGYSQIVPMEDINLHFTGDFHAIAAANNLMLALLDNHIYQGNELNIDTKKIYVKRVLDMNERQLRKVVSGGGSRINGVERNESFEIVVASEVMAIFCLAEDIFDLKEKLGDIVVAEDINGKYITARDIKANKAMAALLKDAIKPNLVQTLENTPAIIHGGPFANIAHGCNSIIATKLAMQLADYTVTEAGFGADLGAEKFLDIKCRKAEIYPDVVVLVATVKSLKMHGGEAKENLQKENVEAVKKGVVNLEKHIENMKKEYGLDVVVSLNKYIYDTPKEIEIIEEVCRKHKVPFAISENWEKGGEGAKKLATLVVEQIDKKAVINEKEIYDKIYSLEDEILKKITKIAQKIYGADGIQVLEKAREKIAEIEEKGYSKLPVCIAKTPFSLSDDGKLIGRPNNFKLKITDVKLANGAGFVVVYCGNVLTMPGLPKIPAANNIDIDENGKIVGLF